ncbi:MAG: hypothetical protein K6U74_08775, partial [Firmicutes bacterium]|nr:hypothetical protein [Bacillota bacterium]
MQLDEFLVRLDGVKKSGAQYTALCPAHNDTEQSLSVKQGDDGRILLNCFVGCDVENIVGALGLKLADLFPRNEFAISATSTSPRLTVEALAADKGLPVEFLESLGVTQSKNHVQITYLLEDGSPAPRQRIRRALRAKDGSLWTKGEGSPDLYGLWKLSEARELGFVVCNEGESDCWTLWYYGFPALGFPGADTTKKLKLEHVKGISKIYIIREPDKGGDTFIAGLTRQFSSWKTWQGELFEVRLSELTGAKDPNDLHRRNPDEFKTLFNAALEKAHRIELKSSTPKKTEKAKYEPGVIPAAAEPGKPPIDAGCQDLQAVTIQAIEALKMANKDNPRLFLHGGPVRIEPDDFGNLVTRELTPDRLRNELARTAFWYKVNEEGEQRPAKPPNDICKNILATPSLPFPVLFNITQAPTFGPDGTLEITEGYHQGSYTYYVPAPGLSVPTVPACPSPADIAEAKKIIFDELLCDFPFADQADKAHAVALLELSFVRPMIKGLTPLHLFEAPTQGSGKGLLTDVLLYPALGQSVGVIPPPRDDEELRKSITSRLKEGRSAVLLDNVHTLKSAVLAAALTAPVWSDRVLGKNETLNMPIRWVWVATSNNAVLDTDIARRAVRIRLNPREERPWLRTGFRHPDLRAWVAEHRGEVIWAALVLAQAWIAAGRPPAKVTPLGSFESWTAVIGGILEYAGIEGFLSNALQFYAVADTEGAVWRAFVASWVDKFGSQPVKAGDLFPLALAIDGLDLGKGATERAQKTAFGMKLARMRDRIFDGYRIEAAGTMQRAQLWRLNQVNLCEPRESFLPRGKFSGEDKDIKEKNIYQYEKVHIGSQGSHLPAETDYPPETPETGVAVGFAAISEEAAAEDWE